MSFALVMAIGALFAGAMSDLIYKRAQGEGIDAPRLILVQATFFTGAIEIFALLRGDYASLPVGAWPYLLPAGILNYSGLVLFVHSLRHGDAGVNAPVFRLSFAVTAIFAILFLHETPTIPRLIGLVLAMGAILALMNTAALTRPGVRTSLWQAGLATVLFGLGGLLTKGAANAGATTVALTAGQAITFYLGALLFPILTGRFPPRKVEFRWGPFTAFFQLAWAVMTYQALQTGDASVAFPVASLGFVLTAVMAIPVFKEPATAGKFLGLGLAMFAVIAFALA